MEITIKGQAYPAELPGSYAIRREVWLSAVRNYERGCVAALGVCCPAVVRIANRERVDGASVNVMRVRPYASDYNPLRFGGELLDAMVVKGLDAVEVVELGATCWSQLEASFATEGDVAEAVDFSESEEAGTS